MSNIANTIIIIFYVLAIILIIFGFYNTCKHNANSEKLDDEFNKCIREYSDIAFAMVRDTRNQINTFEDKINKFEVEYEANFNDQRKRIDGLYRKWSDINSKIRLLDDKISQLEHRIDCIALSINVDTLSDELFVKDTPLSDMFDEHGNVKTVEEVKED